jgi:hypothetical protein
MPDTVTIYLFRDNSFAPAGDTVVCVADRAAIEAALGQIRLETLFGGAATYTDRASRVDYTGVWGKRNCSRLRTLLRACGVEITISRARPSGARLHYFSHGRHTRGRSRRLGRQALQSFLVQNS